MNTEIFVVWQKIYREYFEVEIDVSGLQVPEIYDPEKHFLVVVAKGLEPAYVAFSLQKKFGEMSCEQNSWLNKGRNVRNTEKTYLIIIEKDDQMIAIGDSESNKLPQYVRGITLLERLLLEALYYHEQSDLHLDVTWEGRHNSLCLGTTLPCSRREPLVLTGRVEFNGYPVVYWDEYSHCIRILTYEFGFFGTNNDYANLYYREVV